MSKVLSSKSIRLEARVYGLVHGVFFRANTREKARELGLVGYVRNTEEGVEVIAEGPVEAADEFEQFLWHASPLAQVESVESRRSRPTGEYRAFNIL